MTTETLAKRRDYRAILWFLAIAAAFASSVACLVAANHHKRSLYDVWAFGSLPAQSFAPATIEDVSRYWSWLDLIPSEWSPRRSYYYRHSYYHRDLYSRQATLRYSDSSKGSTIYRVRRHWNTCEYGQLEEGRIVDVYESSSGDVVIKQCLDTARGRVPYVLMALATLLPLSALTWRLWRMR